MHMADALISPAVGGTCGLASPAAALGDWLSLEHASGGHYVTARLKTL